MGFESDPTTGRMPQNNLPYSNLQEIRGVAPMWHETCSSDRCGSEVVADVELPRPDRSVLCVVWLPVIEAVREAEHGGA